MNDLNAKLVADKSSLDLKEADHSTVLRLSLTDKNNNPLPTDDAVILQETSNYGTLSNTQKLTQPNILRILMQLRWVQLNSLSL